MNANYRSPKAYFSFLFRGFVTMWYILKFKIDPPRIAFFLLNLSAKQVGRTSTCIENEEDRSYSHQFSYCLKLQQCALCLWRELLLLSWVQHLPYLPVRAHVFYCILPYLAGEIRLSVLVSCSIMPPRAEKKNFRKAQTQCLPFWEIWS